MNNKYKYFTRYDIEADININDEAYYIRERNNNSGEYVLYSEIEKLLLIPKHESPIEKAKRELDNFKKLIKEVWDEGFTDEKELLCMKFYKAGIKDTEEKRST